MMNNNDSCYSNDDVDFCNGAAPLHIIMRKRDYNHNRDCMYIDGYAFTSPPPGMCLFSTEDMEDIDDADTHTSFSYKEEEE